MTVLITGGAGYIGSHVAWEFLDHGEQVVILDNLVTGIRENVPKPAAFFEGCVGDRDLVADLITRHAVDTIVHCAGSTVVPESVSDPLKYYRNNVVAPTCMLDVAISRGVRTIVFSSTAAVYGIPQQDKVPETHPLMPTSPYGSSKLMFESILADSCRAYEATHASLRYFNVAGADPKGRTGQSTPDATHLLKVCAEVALGKRDELIVYGTDYDTPDGTCIRDFIHVSDLAAVHVLAVKHIRETGQSLTLNCGYSRGFSVRDVVAEVERQTGASLPQREGQRRAGDVPRVVADSRRLSETLGWTPRFDNLTCMVADALRWESRFADSAT